MDEDSLNIGILVSLCNGIKPAVIESISICKALERIQNGSSKEQVEKIRSAINKKEREELKKQLPSVIFQGEFSYRDKNHLVKHSQLAVIDTDHINDPAFYRDYIFDNYDFVLSAWISPSGYGVKHLCRIPEVSTDQDYKKYYSRLLQLFDDANTDPSCSDISRICFESWDPGIRIREWEKTSLFNEIFESSSAKVADSQPLINGSPLNVAAKMIQNSVDGKKHFTLLKASRLCGGYIAGNVIIESDAIALLETEIQKKNIVNFSHAQKTIRSGIAYGKQNPIYPIANDMLNGQKMNDADIFWYENDKGWILFDTVKLLSFIHTKGIYRYYTGSTDYIFIKIENNLVEQIDIPTIKKLLWDHVLSVNDTKVITALQYKIHVLAGPANLQLLDSRNIPIFRGERDAAYIFYENFIYKVTKDSINSLDYSDFNHLIWKNTIIKRKAPYDQQGTSEFETFLDNVFKDEASRILIRQSLGYILHNFKNKAFMPALILNDNNEDDNSQGGTGKGIIAQALSKFLKPVTEDGKKIDISRVFSYQNIDLDTQLFIIDDAKKHFNLEELFSFISEGVHIEKKGKQPIRIEFEDMPKIVITTNYALKGSGESHKRRRLDVVLDNHYSSKHTPYDEFGHMLFDDWDAEQWNLFDIFMLRCISRYLEEGVHQIQHDKLLLKQFRLETHSDFEDFGERLELNTNLNKNEILEKWRRESGNAKFSKRQLTTWLTKFAKIKGYELISDRINDTYVLNTNNF
jgi:hypothetical protein